MTDMKELIFGLLGGGVVVQLLNLLVSARPSRRKLTAEALDVEIAVLERTLKVMSDNMEMTNQRHVAEINGLKSEIHRLEKRVGELTDMLEKVKIENLRLQNIVSTIDAGKLLETDKLSTALS